MSDAFDQPEVWLALQGFLVAFVWEMFQMPFFAIDHLSAWEVTKSCGIASFGDSGIMVFAYWIASRIVGDRLWLQQATLLPVFAYLTTGLVITIAFEHLALRSDWGWQYSDLMPTVFEIGIVPIAMWISVPLIALKFTARITSGQQELALPSGLVAGIDANTKEVRFIMQDGRAVAIVTAMGGDVQRIDPVNGAPLPTVDEAKARSIVASQIVGGEDAASVQSI